MYDIRDQFMIADEKGVSLNREPDNDIRKDTIWTAKPSPMFILNLTGNTINTRRRHFVAKIAWCRTNSTLCNGE
jgi:hypothetical protein